MPPKPPNWTNALMIPEIIALIGNHLPLFGHRFNASYDRNCVTWDPKTLLSVATVCRTWHSVLTGVLWHTYDRVLMECIVPNDVLARNVHLIRRLSLLDECTMNPDERRALRQALRHHQHISSLEVFEEVFLHQRLFELHADSLSELKLTGTGTRVGVTLITFVESLHNLKCLELAQYKFTPTDWKRLVTGKPHLRQLAVLEKGVYNEGRGTIVSGSRRIKHACRREDIEMANAADLGTLPITHLIINDSKFHFALRESTFRASPNLKQLETSLPRSTRNQDYTQLIRDHCQKLQVLTVYSKHSTSTQTIIKEMPQTVQELVLHLAHAPSDLADSIIERRASLTRLELDFVNPRNAFSNHPFGVKKILQKCSELREFVYHHHTHDRFFACMVLRDKWKLPHLKTLRLHGLDPYCRMNNRDPLCENAGSNTPTTIPVGWRRDGGEAYCGCCYFQMRGNVFPRIKDRHAPFDAVLLHHVQDLPCLSEVVITEAVYKRPL